MNSAPRDRLAPPPPLRHLKIGGNARVCMEHEKQIISESGSGRLRLQREHENYC